MTSSIQLPLAVSALCLDEAAIKAALDVGMIVIARCNYNFEIDEIISAHMGVDEAHNCANNPTIIAPTSTFVIALFPAEDGMAEFVAERAFNTVERFVLDEFKSLSLAA
jgi:hypothetical protein